MYLARKGTLNQWMGHSRDTVIRLLNGRWLWHGTCPFTRLLDGTWLWWGICLVTKLLDGTRLWWGTCLLTRLLDGTQSSINGHMSSLTRTETVVYLVILTGCWMRHNEVTTDKSLTSKSTNWLSGASTAVPCCALVLERKRQHTSHSQTPKTWK